MSVHIRVKERDGLRERLFKDTYGLSVKIHTTEHNDENWNWDLCAITFVDSLGNNYNLIEHFKEGNDNSTDFVLFEYQDPQSVFKQERFVTFIEAELALVGLMKQRGAV